MLTRSIIVTIVAIAASVTLTVAIFLVRDAFAFDPFAEVVINNDSGEVISVAELTSGDSVITFHNIRSGERRPIRFNRFPPSLDAGYSLSVLLADGRHFPESGGSIGTGEKQEKLVRRDRVDTILVRSSP